ncbi:hypothetical protein VCR12J2_590015 [Vibrio coralliirubri]|nr:hypothetical protein VCR12J2_590015 [Vibrio coralliirubri]
MSNLAEYCSESYESSKQHVTKNLSRIRTNQTFKKAQRQCYICSWLCF